MSIDMEKINLRLQEIREADQDIEEAEGFLENVLALTLREIAVRRMINQIQEMSR